MQLFSQEYYRTASNARKGDLQPSRPKCTKEIWARECWPQILRETFRAITTVIIHNSNSRVKILCKQNCHLRNKTLRLHKQMEMFVTGLLLLLLLLLLNYLLA